MLRAATHAAIEVPCDREEPIAVFGAKEQHFRVAEACRTLAAGGSLEALRASLRQSAVPALGLQDAAAHGSGDLNWPPAHQRQLPPPGLAGPLALGPRTLGAAECPDRPDVPDEALLEELDREAARSARLEARCLRLAADAEALLETARQRPVELSRAEAACQMAEARAQQAEGALDSERAAYRQRAENFSQMVAACRPARARAHEAEEALETERDRVRSSRFEARSEATARRRQAGELLQMHAACRVAETRAQQAEEAEGVLAVDRLALQQRNVELSQELSQAEAARLQEDMACQEVCDAMA